MSGAAGLVVLVTGTFLPWLHSGRATHNSYQADGTIQRLLAVPGVARSALSAWPFVGVGAAAAVALVALGAARLGAALALLLALAAGTVAVATLTVDATTFASPAGIGPGVTLFGACIVGLAAILLLARRRSAGGPGRSTT